ncbi:MAG TPA: hypothetical protein VHX88_03685 [Solirubrobacteraceae bacterium]|nr:hypothetical protein [Solirubrobacteraceae bacterium]
MSRSGRAKDQAHALVHRLSGPVAARTAQEIHQTAPVETPRDYFLALAEYQRRRTHAIAHAELAAHELRVSSQNGEDGVIQEIFRRIGTGERPFFVEFGGEIGSEGNAVLLADAAGWEGLFLEADPSFFGRLARKYRHGPVQTRQALVSPSNIEQLLEEAGVPHDFDLLSIDIDGDDYWIWKALEAFRPRLVVIEYNAERAANTVQVFGHRSAQHTNDFGASIEALVGLGTEKGYRLVHTEIVGLNAFFVRDDLAAEFGAPRIAGTNFYLRAQGHPEPALARPELSV